MVNKRQYKYVVFEKVLYPGAMAMEQREIILASNQREAESKARELYPGKLLEVERVYKWVEKTRKPGTFDITR